MEMDSASLDESYECIQSDCPTTHESATSEIDDICNRLIAGDSAVDIRRDQVHPVIDSLRTRRQLILDTPDDADFDYDGIERIEEVLAQLADSHKILLSSDAQQSKLSRITERITLAKKQLKQTTEQYSAMKTTFQARRSAAILRLQHEQERELVELDASYTDEIPPKYRKFSIELMNMRAQEKTLRAAHLYKDAKQLKQAADSKEASEMEVIYAKWTKAKISTRQAVLQKHKLQMKCLNEKWDQRWRELEPGTAENRKRLQLVINTHEKRMKEVQGKTDFHVHTGRGPARTRKEHLPQLASRPHSSRFERNL
jgi:hypothetical protein